MTFLSSTLPGFRQLRTPLAVGLLWLGVATILLAPNDHLLSRGKDADALEKLIGSIDKIYAVPLLLGLGYVIGVVANGITGAILRLLGGLLQRLIQQVTGYSKFYRILRKVGVGRRLHQLAIHVRLESKVVSRTARGLIFSSVRSTLGKVGVFSNALFVFPVERAISEINHCAIQLSQSAEPQYQEYDRIRSEAEFRSSIAPPLIALSVVTPISGRPWAVGIALIFAVCLLFQSFTQLRKANDILANCTYLGYIQIPSVQAVVDHLIGLENELKKTSDWMAAIAISLSRRGFHEEYLDALWEIVELCDGGELNEVKSYFDTVGGNFAKEFANTLEERLGPEKSSVIKENRDSAEIS